MQSVRRFAGTLSASARMFRLGKGEMTSRDCLQTSLECAKEEDVVRGKHKSKGPTFVGPLLEGIGLRGRDLNVIWQRNP